MGVIWLMEKLFALDCRKVNKNLLLHSKKKYKEKIMQLIDFLYLRYFMNKTCSFTATPIIS